MAKWLNPFEKRWLVKMAAFMTNAELAEEFGVCLNTVDRTLYRMKRLGVKIPPRPWPNQYRPYWGYNRDITSK